MIPPVVFVVSVDDCCDSLDGHSVTNLVSIDRGTRIKGFLADRFIKPPAIITLTFKCNVDVSKVVLNPRVGSQKSAGFEILKVYKNRTTTSIAQVVVKEHVERVEFSRYDVGEGIVKFSSNKVGELVRQMQIKIFKTFGSTVPALGGLELWGRPSVNVSVDLKNEITTLWKSIICSQVVSTKDVPTESVSEKPSTSRNIVQDIVVPEEFIDPISCEIMTIPMTLPSGKIVDLSTLEKFHSAESKLGRGKSDPFTGVLFSERNKPVVATSLKSRLDKFILENCNNPSIKVLPRALGKKVAAPPAGAPPASVKQESSSRSSNQVAQTVDQLLFDCLQGLPSYLDAPPAAKKTRKSCVSCPDSSVTCSDTYMFQLPCEHIVCRNCLCVIKGNSVASCTECQQTFKFDCVQRYHTC